MLLGTGHCTTIRVGLENGSESDPVMFVKIGIITNICDEGGTLVDLRTTCAAALRSSGDSLMHRLFALNLDLLLAGDNCLKSRRG